MYPVKYRTFGRPMNGYFNFDDVMTRDFFFNPMKSIWGNVPSVNVKEDDSAFHIEVAAPGLEKGDFKIELVKDVLTISTEKKVEKSENSEKYSRREFAYNNFRRSFSLPENVKVDGIKASYENGLLNVVLPKEESTPATNKQIVVE